MEPRSSADLAALLSRVSLGDRTAFERLYEQTAALLLGLILRIDRQRATAEDTLQEVYVKVWRSAGSFNVTQGQPMTWLGSIARHAAIDSLRRRQAQPREVSTTVYGDEDVDDHDLLQAFASDAPGPAQQLQASAEAQALRQCLQVLNGEQSQAVALAFYQGLTYAEVAAHLSQPLGTVKSWLRRGLQALKGCLQAKEAGV